MARQDFENFKLQIKNWLDTHPDEYDEFLEEIEDESSTGLMRIFYYARSIAPIMMKKILAECHGDLANEKLLQSYKLENDAVKKLVDDFKEMDEESIVPAMLAWLYYGKCFETMVIHLEVEALDERNTTFERALARMMVKFVMVSSVLGKQRKIVDWKNYLEERKAAGEEHLFEFYIKYLKSPNIKGRPKIVIEGELKDYLFGNKDLVFERIKNRLDKQNTGNDITMLYFALHKTKLIHPCEKSTFYKLLTDAFPNYNFITFRTFERAHKNLMKEKFTGEHQEKLINLGENGKKLEEWCSYLKGEIKSV